MSQFFVKSLEFSLVNKNYFTFERLTQQYKYGYS
jgi:hypothetical protein